MSRVSSFLRDHWVTLLVILGLTVGYFALRTSPTEIASAREFVDSLSQGQPTIVYFYSNA